MKSAEFIHTVAAALTLPVESVTVYARKLKEAGLLSTGARGRNAPEMTAMDAARLVIALLASDGPSTCVERTRRFGNLKFTPGYKKRFRWYQAMTTEEFSKFFVGETLEKVLANWFGLPAKLGIEPSLEWFEGNVFHLRISPFQVRAELFRDLFEGDEVVGELAAPFKGNPMDSEFTPIKGGILTDHIIRGEAFTFIGVALVSKEASHLKPLARFLVTMIRPYRLPNLDEAQNVEVKP